MSLLCISQQITIYLGISLAFAGIIGNGMNIFAFSNVHTYRTTPSTFYFLVISIDNILYILIILISRIVSAGFGIDLTRTSVSWCKARQFLAGSLSAISYNCSCLATIDQFLVTSKSVHLCRYSQIQWSYKIVFIIIIVWCLHGIPTLLYSSISFVSNMCITTNTVYAAYIPVYLLGILCIIPSIIMIVFGCLTYRNIRQTRLLAEQHADRQLTRMTLIQVILVVISTIPYGILNAYNTITAKTPKDSDQQLKEYFISTIIPVMAYLYYVGNFYIFWFSSSRFRLTIKNRMHWWRRQNQIHTIQI